MSDEKDDDAKRRAERAEAVRLGWPARIAFVLLGAGSTTVGVFAVIHKGMEGAAVVAFIVVALVLWLFGLVGHIPARVWGKDIGIEMGSLPVAVTEAIAAAVPASRRPEVAEALADSGQPANPAEAALGRSLAKADIFDKRCQEYVKRAVASLSENSEAQALLLGKALKNLPSGIGDAMVDSKHGTVVVEFRIRLSMLYLGIISGSFEAWREQTGQPSRLIILTESARQTFLDTAKKFGVAISIVQVGEGDDSQEAVTEAIRGALESLKAESVSRQS